MKKILLGLSALLATSLMICAEEAQGDVSIGLKAGTLGIGVEANKAYGEKLSFRLGYNFLEQSEDVEDGDTTYTGDLELSNGGLYVDWHPWAGGFRLTGGVMMNNNEVTLKAKPTAVQTVEIGSTTYDISSGQLNGKVDFDTFAPYLGMGWGKAVGASSRWAFLFDLGVMFQGSPNVDLNTSGTIRVGAIDVSTVPGLQATLQNEIQREKSQIKADLEDFEIYPVVSLGLTYRF